MEMSDGPCRAPSSAASALRHNKASQDKVHEAYRSVRAILEGELDRRLDWDQRKFILEKLMETADREFEKDSENKKFIETTFGKVLTGVGGVAVAAAFVLGGWTVARSSEDDQSKEGSSDATVGG